KAGGARPDPGPDHRAALFRRSDARRVGGGPGHFARVGRSGVPCRQGMAGAGALGRMNAERWGEVCRLFDAAREIPEPKRAAFLQRECRGDRELEAEVLSLLAKDEGESFLDEPGPAALPIRRRVGPYEVV